MKTKATRIAEISDNIKAYCDQYHDDQFQPDNPIVSLHEPTFGHEEITAAVEVLLSTYVTQGKRVRAFEQQYAAHFNYHYGVMNNSGSSANLLAISALCSPLTKNRLHPGDEVIVPALSWSTTVWPLIQLGLIPVMVDCDLATLNLDMEQVAAAISPKTRAIMPVHVYGNPCDMDTLMQLATDHDLMVIEDSCESMGARYDGKAVGSFGRVGTFSFYYSHHITTLEGGICVTDDFELTEVMRIQRAHGWSREADQHQKYVQQYPTIDPRFIFVDVGYNLRVTELQAAFGEKQLPKLDDFIAKRRETAHYFNQHLQQYAEFFYFQQITPKGESVWFGFPMIIKPNAPFTVSDITQFLQAKGIETRPIIAGNMAQHPGLQHYSHRVVGGLENANRVMQQGFAIGCHHAIDAQARAYVVEMMHAAIAYCTAAEAVS